MATFINIRKLPFAADVSAIVMSVNIGALHIVLARPLRFLSNLMTYLRALFYLKVIVCCSVVTRCWKIRMDAISDAREVA